MNIEVVYALPETQKIIELVLAEESTVQDAVKLSGLSDIYPGIEPGTTPVGIFGERVQYNTCLLYTSPSPRDS